MSHTYYFECNKNSQFSTLFFFFFWKFACFSSKTMINYTSFSFNFLRKYNILYMFDIINIQLITTLLNKLGNNISIKIVAIMFLAEVRFMLHRGFKWYYSALRTIPRIYFFSRSCESERIITKGDSKAKHCCWKLSKDTVEGYNYFNA